ncbi:hypothetical protein [Rhizobium leguminosarum]
MSVLGTFVGNVDQPVSVALSGTSLTDVVTATDDSLTSASVAFANDSAGAVTCYIYWYQASTTTDFMIWVGSVPTKTTTIVSDLPIRLRDGDKVKVIGAASVKATVINMLNFALGR